MTAEQRAFSYAVLASIVLHGIVLFGVSLRDRPHRVAEIPPPIAARLVAPEPALPILAPRLVPEREIPRQKQKPRAKPVPKPAPAKSGVVRQPEPAPRIAESAPAPAEASPAPAPAPPVVARTEPAASAPPAAPAAPEKAMTDATTVAQYRMQVLSAARKYKRYPRVAMDNNWEGDVVVRMALGADGRPKFSIEKSSKHLVLDEQALEMFRRAAAAVPLPSALQGREFSIDVRAIYDLRDQDSG